MKDLISSHYALILQKWKRTMNKMRGRWAFDLCSARKPFFLKNNPKKPQKINIEELQNFI